MNILILEDDADDQYMIRTLLESKGKTGFEIFATIPDLLQAIPKAPFLLLTDYMLGGADTGLKAIQEVIKINPVMQFIVMSSKPTVDILKGIINLHSGFGFVNKNEDGFLEELWSELLQSEKDLHHKVKKVIEQEKRRQELLTEAERVLQTLES